MSVPRKMQEFAAIYGCEIVERYSGNPDEGDILYAQANGNEEMVCRSYYGNHVDLNQLKDILQRVSGRTLAQYWIGR